MSRPYFHDHQIESLFAGADAIVFDMNGLLIDDEPLQLQAYNQVLQPRGIDVTPQWWTDRCLGRKAGQFVRELLAEHGQSPELFPEILAAKEKAYARLLHARGPTLVRPGVCTLLEHLHREPAWHIAIATSAHRKSIAPLMGEVGLDYARFFEVIVTGDEVTHGKPDPEIFLAVRSQLPSCRHFLVLEDSPPGLKAAKAAGMLAIAVPNSLTCNCDLSQADLVISDLTPAAGRL